MLGVRTEVQERLWEEDVPENDLGEGSEPGQSMWRKSCGEEKQDTGGVTSTPQCSFASHNLCLSENGA
jgi:hypothetical protein